MCCEFLTLFSVYSVIRLVHIHFSALTASFFPSEKKKRLMKPASITELLKLILRVDWHCMTAHNTTEMHYQKYTCRENFLSFCFFYLNSPFHSQVCQKNNLHPSASLSFLSKIISSIKHWYCYDYVNVLQYESGNHTMNVFSFLNILLPPALECFIFLFALFADLSFTDSFPNTSIER